MVLSASEGSNAGEPLPVFRVALTALDGTVLDRRQVSWEPRESVQLTLAAIAREFDDLLAHASAPLWGIGLSIPTPVALDTGRPMNPPGLGHWNGFDVRGWFSSRYDVGTWVDNDAHVRALGSATLTGADDLLYVELGRGLSVGVVSQGRVQRGRTGSAGSIGHVTVDASAERVCRCGRRGCLDALVAGWAIENEAITAQVEGRSQYLDSVLRADGQITVVTVGAGAREADPACVQIVADCATRVSAAAAMVATASEPAMVVIGGDLVRESELFVEVFTRNLRVSAPPRLSERLEVRVADPDDAEGAVGCTRLVVDDLLGTDFLEAWVPAGAPGRIAAISARAEQHRPDELSA